ncbi:hypothetical protein HXX76_008217 [Chlamydomonas incerta]|uniref:Uncharacterized protein n=1 Tax=Chlamydomonas incerta TaxID=51695 RepID=A0A835T122_CHLIN|nr:hypothetical protein HXX76_008217 [Chlamydomonas incerta]|eukprot:KAG2433863.1 hypothetical protein HXX76_008217 [Chlamydomonas incerta]
MAPTLLAQQQRGAAAACAAAPGRALRCNFSASAPRRAAPRPSASAFRVLNTASGSRGSPPHQQQPEQQQGEAVSPAEHKPSSPKISPASRRTSAVLPDAPSSFFINAAAGLAGGLLLTAAAMHLSGDAHAAVLHADVASSVAGSSLAAFREFGPADLVSRGFGPARPLWTMLLHSHTHAASAASAYITTPHATAAATGAAQHLPHLPLPDLAGAFAGGGGGGGGGPGSLAAPSSVSELWAQASGAAQESAAHVSEAAHGLVAQTVDGYNAWLEESPLMCKIVTGNFFTVAGDMLAQLGCGSGGGHGAPEAAEPSATAAASAGGRRRVDWARTARLCTETSLVGTPLAHWWFNLLDARILPDDPHCPAAVLSKMLLDQLLFAPLGLALFFVVIKLLEGRPHDISRSLRTSYVKSLLGGYLLWPAAGLLNFALLPNEYRLLFNNCVNIIWTCFLSIMSSSDNTEHVTTAAGAPPPAPAPAAAVAPAPAASSRADTLVAGGFMAGAQDFAATAVAAAALGAACSSDRAALGAVAGLAVAVVEATCHSAANAAAATPAPVAAQTEPAQQQPGSLASAESGSACSLAAAEVAVSARSYAGGGSVLVGGPCLEVCERERDEASC